MTELRRAIGDRLPTGGMLACGAAAGLVGVAVQGLIDTVSVVIFRAVDAHDGVSARGGARQHRPGAQ